MWHRELSLFAFKAHAASTKAKMDPLCWAQGLMDFVLTHASQLLANDIPDATVCLSAAETISQICEVAEGHGMAMQDATLTGLLQLIQQAAHPEVAILPCCTICPRLHLLVVPPLQCVHCLLLGLCCRTYSSVTILLHCGSTHLVCCDSLTARHGMYFITAFSNLAAVITDCRQKTILAQRCAVGVRSRQLTPINSQSHSAGPARAGGSASTLPSMHPSQPPCSAQQAAICHPSLA